MATTPPGDLETQQLIEAAFKGELDVPSLYFNGFTQAITPSDVAIVLTRNGVPCGLVNAPYETIKELTRKLGEGVASLEKQVGAAFMYQDDIYKAITKSEPKS